MAQGASLQQGRDGRIGGEKREEDWGRVGWLLKSGTERNGMERNGLIGQCVQSISVAFERCVLCVVVTYCIHWLGSVAKTINFHSYGTSRDQRGGSTYLFRGSP